MRNSIIQSFKRQKKKYEKTQTMLITIIISWYRTRGSKRINIYLFLPVLCYIVSFWRASLRNFRTSNEFNNIFNFDHIARQQSHNYYHEDGRVYFSFFFFSIPCFRLLFGWARLTYPTKLYLFAITFRIHLNWIQMENDMILFERFEATFKTRKEQRFPFKVKLIIRS